MALRPCRGGDWALAELRAPALQPRDRVREDGAKGWLPGPACQPNATERCSRWRRDVTTTALLRRACPRRATTPAPRKPPRGRSRSTRTSTRLGGGSRTRCWCGSDPPSQSQGSIAALDAKAESPRPPARAASCLCGHFHAADPRHQRLCCGRAAERNRTFPFRRNCVLQRAGFRGHEQGEGALRHPAAAVPEDGHRAAGERVEGWVQAAVAAWCGTSRWRWRWRLCPAVQSGDARRRKTWRLALSKQSAGGRAHC